MPTRKRSSQQSNTTEILRGGKAVPKDLVSRCIADLQQRRSKEAGQRIATERRMSKYLGGIQGATKPNPNDPRVAQSLDGLLGMHQKLAKQKLLAPKVPGGLGGIFPGRITVTVVPPFDYSVVIPTSLAGHDAIREASSDRNTGKMNASAITSSEPGFGGGSMYTTVGVYFHPLAAGTVTFHAAPIYSFQWWTNSIGANSDVQSFGSGGLTIYGVDVAAQTTGGLGTIVSTAGTNFKLWDESQTDQVRFDFGFDIQAPTTVQIDVTPHLVYLLFVDADVHVHGIGWPGSLAGAKMAVTVPSITYDFQAEQVFQQ
jgi:hypothetical protein